MRPAPVWSLVFRRGDDEELILALRVTGRREAIDLMKKLPCWIGVTDPNVTAVIRYRGRDIYTYPAVADAASDRRTKTADDMRSIYY